MLKSEINNNEVLAAVLQPVMLFVQEATHTEYDNLMSATMKWVWDRDAGGIYRWLWEGIKCNNGNLSDVARSGTLKYITTNK